MSYNKGINAPLYVYPDIIYIMKEKKDKITSYFNKRVRLKIQGIKYPRDQTGIIRQIRNDDFDFRIFGSNRKHIIKYSQVTSISDADLQNDDS